MSLLLLWLLFDILFLAGFVFKIGPSFCQPQIGFMQWAQGTYHKAVTRQG